MEQLTTELIKNSGLLIFEAISGSRAYGLDNADSDTDIRGIFVLPQDRFYGFGYTGQVNNVTNDIVYYELKRFIELLAKNNPNILELLNMPESCILHRDDRMDLLKPELFLSKLCESTFANYAYTQIKKACGLEKKITAPMEAERKTVTDFCFVYADGKTVPLTAYMQQAGAVSPNFGLAAISHLRDCYNLYCSDVIPYRGVVSGSDANDVCLSSIPKGEKPAALLYFNKDRYSVYCKKYREYQDWIKLRNEKRYAATLEHGKKYDAKNMMHVFRLLHMAKEIALENRLNVFRKDRDFLLSVKAGRFEYEELLAMADTLKAALTDLYRQSALPDEPDMTAAEQLLIKMRRLFY